MPEPTIRAVDVVLARLPDVRGRRVLDLGCGIGEQAAALSRRGAVVVGVDGHAGQVEKARARGLPDATFVNADLRNLPDLGARADGLWCSYAAAYFPSFVPVLRGWSARLADGAWVVLVEIDDLFGHEPLVPRTRELLEAYAAEALEAGRYDFRQGRKLREHLEASGFVVEREETLPDPELAFDGPAAPATLDAWRARLSRMSLLQQACGTDFEAVRDDLLACLASHEHRSQARVIACTARLQLRAAG